MNATVKNLQIFTDMIMNTQIFNAVVWLLGYLSLLTPEGKGKEIKGKIHDLYC